MSRLLLILSMTFSFLALISCTIELIVFSDRHFDFYYYFYFCIYTLVILLCAYTLKADKHLFQKINLKNKFLLLIILLSLLTGLLLAHNQYSERDIWLDESTQIDRTVSKIDYPPNVINLAASQQQTPLDYNLSFLSAMTLGKQKIAVRLFAILFFILTLVILPLIVFKFTNSISTTLLAQILYLSNPVLTYYSVEGRPIQAAIFFSLAYLYFTLKVLLSGDRISWKAFVAVTILFILSTGLQPVWLCFSIAVPLLIYYFNYNRIYFKRFLAVHAIAAVVVLPAILLIHKKSVSLNQFYNNWQTRTSNYMEYFGPYEILKYFEGFQPALSIAGFLLFCAFFLKSKFTRVILLFTLSFCLFIFTFDLFFFSYINWEFYYRYVIVLAPLFILIVCFCFYVATSRFSKENTYLQYLIVFAISGQILFYNRVRNNDYLSVMHFSQSFDSGIYKIALEKTSNDDIVTRFDPYMIGVWRPNFWESIDYYIDPEKNTQFFKPNRELTFGFSREFFIPYKALNNSSLVKLVLITRQHFYEGFNLQEAWTEAGLEFEFYKTRFESVFVFTLQPKKGREIVYKILNSLVKKIENPLLLDLIYEHYIYFCYKDNDKQCLEENIKKYLIINELLDKNDRFYLDSFKRWKSVSHYYKKLLSTR